VAAPREETLLYLEWARGAGGRFLLPDEGAVPAPAAVLVAPLPAEPEGEGQAPPVAATAESLASLAVAATACRRCGLCETRTTVVFGEGAPRPRLMFVGEAPGADEDRTGRPFVGRAGQLLTKMIQAIGLSREDVYIANVLKCRPPENRPPRPDEVATCRPFLEEQIRLLAPALVVALGNHAVRALLETDRGIGSLRGRVQSSRFGVPILPTYHPAYLLRTPEAKREAWQDLQLAAKTVGLALPTRGGVPGASPALAPTEGPAGSSGRIAPQASLNGSSE
jgi:DNA polymerase